MKKTKEEIETQIKYYYQQIEEYAPNITNTMLFLARIEALNWVLDDIKGKD